MRTISLSRRVPVGRPMGVRFRGVIFVSLVVAGGLRCGGGKAAPNMDAGAGSGGSGGAGASGGGDAGEPADAADAATVSTPLEHVTLVFPPRDATNVCIDAPL